MVTSTGPGTHKGQFRFHGEGLDLLLLILKNAVLSVVTLGVYIAWGNTDVRKFLLQNFEFAGNRLVYTGTGRELFIGYLKAVGVYLGVVLSVAGLQFFYGSIAAAVGQLLFLLVFLILVPHLLWGALRYRLSRTRWSGIRFTFEGDKKTYLKWFYGSYLLIPLTLGMAYPFVRHHIRKALIESVHFGSEKTRYSGDMREEVVIWYKGVGLSLLTFGIYSFWFLADFNRYIVEHTHFAGARGQLTLTAGDYFVFGLFRLLVLPTTLGIGFPWVLVWELRKKAEAIHLEGELDLTRVRQVKESGSTTAEGLGELLDVDAVL